MKLLSKLMLTAVVAVSLFSFSLKSHALTVGLATGQPGLIIAGGATIAGAVGVGTVVFINDSDINFDSERFWYTVAVLAGITGAVLDEQASDVNTVLEKALARNVTQGFYTAEEASHIFLQTADFLKSHEGQEALTVNLDDPALKNVKDSSLIRKYFMEKTGLDSLTAGFLLEMAHVPTMDIE
ncbi:MAG: hypothetical protein HY390_07290 [Deltaproteobacteria bacterium]|nr:hypothetical protein [Deltaproteobacteria bacterium]